MNNQTQPAIFKGRKGKQIPKQKLILNPVKHLTGGASVKMSATLRDHQQKPFVMLDKFFPFIYISPIPPCNVQYQAKSNEKYVPFSVCII